MAIPTDVQDALDRLSGGYNNGDYNAGTNPLGFSNGGHRINLYALTADMTLVGLWANDQVALISGITGDIEAVAAIAADVTTVADALADVSIVAGIAANVSTVAGDSSEINSLAAITTAISQVAAIVSAVSTVAARDAAIATVAARDAAIGVVAARDAAIGVVAARDADIGIVASIAASVSAVAADGVDIGVVAANIADVGVAADNIVAIQGASESAAAALTARNEAEGFAEAGKHLTLFWAYSTTLTDSNPGAGVFRLNNAAPGAATLLFISLTEAEGGDATAWLDSWDDSTTTANRGTITLVSATDPGTWVKYRVTGANASATGYRKIAIAHVASAGSLGPADEFGFAFAASGDRGTDGLGTGTVVDNGPAVEGNFPVYADSTGVSIEDSGKGPADMVEKANNGADFADPHSTLDNIMKLGVNIASAATLNLDAATGVALTITGTTATSVVTLSSGKWRLVRASGAWPITVGANLTLNNGGSNYVCAVGDLILFVADNSVVRGTVFPANGKALQPPANFTGDSGVGGAKGLVPAPAAGDAAAGKVLGAGGGWVNVDIDGVLKSYLGMVPAIARWKGEQSASRVYWAGTGITVGTSAVSGGALATGRTHVSGAVGEAVRQDGFIRTVKLGVDLVGSSPSNNLKVKVFRPNGATYDLIAESEFLTATTTGMNTFNLATALPVQPGDQMGVWIKGGAGGTCTQLSSATTSAVYRYVEADAGSGATWLDVANISILSEYQGIKPFAVCFGESIIEGHNGASNWHGFGHAGFGPAGNPAAEPFNQVRALIPTFEYQNYAIGGSLWTSVVARTIVATTYAPPKAAVVAAGVNDVAAGTAWSSVLSSMNAWKAALPTGTKLFVVEMLPYPGTDAQAATIRAWNANYATWCADNGATLIPCWNAMGQVRPSTGFKDDLIAGYHYSGGHLTVPAGVDAYAALLADGLQSVLWL